MSGKDDLAACRADIEKLKADNAELQAKVQLLERDLSVIGPENAKLHNAYAAAKAEIARLKAPPIKRSRGRPPKVLTGSYEEYLVRETVEEITKSMRDGGKKLSEKTAAIRADARIRATVTSLNKAGMPAAFAGLANFPPADEESIYTAFRRGKRALKREFDLTRPYQAKK